MRVLVVEDDEGVAARRGADALHRVKGCDLVLLDLGLPDMDGLDVLRTLRRASGVPVIIMTARDANSDGVGPLGGPVPAVGRGVGGPARGHVGRPNPTRRRVPGYPPASSRTYPGWEVALSGWAAAMP